MYTQSVLYVSLTQERAFIVFNSLPEKLIFKTLLWSLFTCATFKTRMPTKPSEMG